MNQDMFRTLVHGCDTVRDNCNAAGAAVVKGELTDAMCWLDDAAADLRALLTQVEQARADVDRKDAEGGAV